MIYKVKKYGNDHYLIVSDPYLEDNLEAIRIEDDEIKDLDIIHSRYLHYFPYYDFKKTISYIIYITLELDKDTVDADKVYFVESLSNILNIPKTQAQQLFLFSTYKENVKVYSGDCFKEAYGISHNLSMIGIPNEVVIFENP